MIINYKKFTPSLLAACSTLADGNMRLHTNALDPAAVQEVDIQAKKNRAAFFKSLGIDQKTVVRAKLVHGNQAIVVGNPKSISGDVSAEADALITGERGVYLSITMADCPALYLYDAQSQAIGLAHCGWKGLAAGIIAKTVEAMRTKLNVNPHDLVAYIGPHARSECYRVKRDVFSEFFPDTKFVSESVPLSLESVITRDLIDAGVLSSKIDSSEECTVCTLADIPDALHFGHYKFFSFRRTRSNPLETQLAVIGLK